jgi:hypothetical protein
MDPTKHNYYKKLMKLYVQGRIPTASLTEVDIFHDDWCGVYSGRYCNCDPDIKLRTQRANDGRDYGHTQSEAEEILMKFYLLLGRAVEVTRVSGLPFWEYLHNARTWSANVFFSCADDPPPYLHSICGT